MSKRRPHMPLAVKLQAAILQLGLNPRRVHYHHDPELECRPIVNGEYDPPANDPRYIRLVDESEHDHITNVDNGSGRSSKSVIAHVRRSNAKHDAHLARMSGEVRGPFFWENRFNGVETDGPFDTIDAAVKDAVAVYDCVQDGFVFDIVIINENGDIAGRGHIKGGEWIYGDYKPKRGEPGFKTWGRSQLHRPKRTIPGLRFNGDPIPAKIVKR